MSKKLTEENGGEETLANGSMLLPFDTEKRSPLPLDDKLPPDMPAQTHYIITDNNDFEPSTVAEIDTYDQGGLSYPGIVYTDNGNTASEPEDNDN